MNIKLVKYIESDFHLFKTMVSDDETMKYIAGSGWTESQARVHFDSMLEINCKEEGLGFYKVVNQENEFIKLQQETKLTENEYLSNHTF